MKEKRQKFWTLLTENGEPVGTEYKRTMLVFFSKADAENALKQLEPPSKLFKVYQISIKVT